MSVKTTFPIDEISTPELTIECNGEWGLNPHNVAPLVGDTSPPRIDPPADAIAINASTTANASELTKIVESSAIALTRTLSMLDTINSRLEALEQKVNHPADVQPDNKSKIKENEKEKLKENVKGEGKEVKESGSKEKKEKSKDKEKEKKTAGADKDNEKGDAPPPPPRKVYVAYKVNCISDISAIMSTFSIDIKLFYYWEDPKFIDCKKNSDVDLSEKGCFNPDIVITNGHDLKEESRTVKVNKPKTGEIKCSVHYVGTVFMTSMDLKVRSNCCNLTHVL